jgi:hypothetical protein
MLVRGLNDTALPQVTIFPVNQHTWPGKYARVSGAAGQPETARRWRVIRLAATGKWSS